MKRIGAARNTAFADRDVAATFRAYPPHLRIRLLALRRLILATAAGTEGVGQLRETLKWRQPSYLTDASKSGTTIRIDQVKSNAAQYALYVHCQTDLVATFRRLYPAMSYDANRAIVFGLDDKVPQRAVRHCIALALTYHRRNKSKQWKRHAPVSDLRNPS
jgi:hypothetical protein